MGGLAVVLLVVGYLTAAVWLVAKAKGARQKLTVLAIALLLPTADAIIGRIYLQHLCDTAGGLRVMRTVDDVAGFLDEAGGGDYWITRAGFQFIEQRHSATGQVDRAELVSGRVVWERGVPAKAAYRYVGPVRRDRGLYTEDAYVVDAIGTGEVLGRNTNFLFKGGWVERLIAALSDAGPGAVAGCDLPSASERWADTVVATLRPSR